MKYESKKTGDLIKTETVKALEKLDKDNCLKTIILMLGGNRQLLSLWEGKS